MADKELLSAIGAMLDEKLEQKLDQKLDQKLQPIWDEILGMKGEISGMKGEISGIKTEIADMKENMVTKTDLKRSENMILAQVDFVQERTNEKFSSLQFRAI